MEDYNLISGKWINVKTGETIQVKDMFEDENGLNIFTTDGIVIDGDTFSNNYIQASDEIYNENGVVIDNNKFEINNVKENFDNLSAAKSEEIKPIQQNDIDIYNEDFNNWDSKNLVAIKEDSIDENLIIFKKVFSKIESKPTIDIDFKWDELNSNLKSVFINYFDLSNEDIAKYIYEYYIVDKIEEIKKLIYDKIYEKINNIN